MRRTRISFASIAAAIVASALFLANVAAAKEGARAAALKDERATALENERAIALRAAEVSRFQANDAADARVLGDLLDDQLEYVHSNGELDTKQSFIASLASGKRDYVRSVPVIESIRFLGDVAIIRGTAKVTVVDLGQSKDLHIGYTNVWVNRNGKWRMTAWRSARLPDSPVK